MKEKWSKTEKCEFPKLEKSLTLFMQQTKPKLIAFLCDYVPPCVCEEIAQEAYIKVFLLVKNHPKQAHTLDDLMKFQALLFTAAKNMAISQLRHNKVVNKHIANSQSNNDSVSPDSIENELGNETEKLLMIEAVNSLPPICRQVFILRKLEAKSHADIARQLHISNKTVENHLTKGLKLCRQYIANKQKQAKQHSIKYKMLKRAGSVS